MKRPREWRKLHVGVNERGFIVAQCLTESRVDDASVAAELLRQVKGRIERFTADGAYDKTAAYDLFTRKIAPRGPPARCSATRRSQT